MTDRIRNILKLLEETGYSDALPDESNFTEILKEGPKNVEFTKLVTYITSEIRATCRIDECVNPISNSDDSVSFLMELSSFLKELGCTYTNFVHGHITDRLATMEDKMFLFEYLIGELFSARICNYKKPARKMELRLSETSNASNLKQILKSFGFSKPPPNITLLQLFQKLAPAVQSAIKKGGPELLGNPIFQGSLSEKQWATLEEVQRDLNEEYTIRREMLLTRLDCTIESFQWSNKTKGKEAVIQEVYQKKRSTLQSDPAIELSDLLGARDDIAIIEKASNALVRKNTRTALNKVIIGQVPDRGGRAWEQAPPPPEMPSWQQRTPGPSGGRGGGGGGRGGGGGGGRGGGGGGGRGGRTFSRGDSNYSRGQNYRGANNAVGSDYKRDYNQGVSGFDSAGSYGNYSNSGYSGGSGIGGGVDNYAGYDAAGGYRGNSSRDYEYQTNDPKRPKTYDYFQQNKTTYADQYVQESQQNQQYHPRTDNRSRDGRGHSNYNRGRGNYY